MGVNLQLLGIQAIPRLAKRFGVQVEFPEERTLFGMAPTGFQKVFKNSGKILNAFFEEFKASWWDVYCNSDIGMERVALAKEMQLQEDDVILDVGCGRGYFSIAAAKFSMFVVGLDLMNEFGRQGWWRNFRISMHELNLFDRVLGVKSDARCVPFKDSSFTLAVAVHSIRNFPDKDSVERAISEMKRVVTEKGNVIIVESLPIARTKAQEAHLQMFRCKVKYTSGELDFLPEKELVEMFHRVRFNKVEVKQLNYDWSAAPPFFCLDASSLTEREREEAQKAYDKAVEIIRKWGDASPPAILVKATK
ncbi:MAG: methyltransferase domain-containing protein [Thermoproteota archaeon]|nr:methyltransferase domain-containing protein [Thermoproteota archaeon]